MQENATCPANAGFPWRGWFTVSDRHFAYCAQAQCAREAARVVSSCDMALLSGKNSG
jgi:hypothetical protein